MFLWKVAEVIQSCSGENHKDLNLTKSKATENANKSSILSGECKNKAGIEAVAPALWLMWQKRRIQT